MSSRKTLFGLPLHWEILIGLIVGAVIGIVVGQHAIDQLPADTATKLRGATAAKIATGSTAYLLLDLVGDLFLNGLKLIVVPLVTSSIILAVARMGTGKDFGRLGLKTLTYYMVTSLIAILIGLVAVNLVRPGVDDAGRGILVDADLSVFADEQAEVASRTAGKDAESFLDVFRQMVPDNVISAASSGQLLGLITVSILVGFFLSRYDGEGKLPVMNFTQGVHDITLRITDFVLMLAPIGVVGLLGATIAEQFAKLRPDDRFDVFAGEIAKFAAVAFVALLLHFVITMPLILSLVARVNPIRMYRAMAPALATAFSTSSSSATLPVTIDCVENRAGVSNRVASFTLPLGATVNMDGTALYECVAAMFICNAFGLELSFAQQFFIVMTALLTSIGVAGVPSASLVAIVIILTGVQNSLPAGSLPEGVMLASAMGLIFVFDRPLDMCRTAVNIFSDSVGATTIARLEGETVLKD